MSDTATTEAPKVEKPKLNPAHSKVIEVNSLGYALKHTVPSTVHEFDRLAGKEGAALDSAIYNVEYRGTLASFRENFVDWLANQTGIERPTEAVLNKDGTPALDEDKEPKYRYVNTEAKDEALIIATVAKDGLQTESGLVTFASIEAVKAHFASDAQRHLDAIAFDPAESERKPTAPKKVAKQYVTLAQSAHDKGTIVAFAAKLAEILGDWKVEPTVDSVAKAIAEDQRRKREAKNLSAEYGQ